MQNLRAPASSSIVAARSTAQPFTSPEGSSGPSPGRGSTAARAPNVMSNAPPLNLQTSSHSARTVVTSGLASREGSSPRPMRLISLSSRHVLNSSSTRSNHRYNASITSGSTSSTTSTPIAVPQSSSTRRTAQAMPARSSADCSDWA